jgi:hypothetical protein
LSGSDRGGEGRNGCGKGEGVSARGMIQAFRRPEMLRATQRNLRQDS